MTNTYNEAVTLYSDETQISLKSHTFPILETIRISDLQTDVQIVPVDSDSMIRNLL